MACIGCAARKTWVWLKIQYPTLTLRGEQMSLSRFCGRKVICLLIYRKSQLLLSEPVWPSGKALGKRKDLGGSGDTALVLLSVSSKRLWSSVDYTVFVLHNYETLKWLSSLPTLMQKSFWWQQYSDRSYNFPLTGPTSESIPPSRPPASQSASSDLINLTVVSVRDVKHHIYLV